MPERHFGDQIQSVFKTILDAADIKYVRPLKRQVFSRSPGSSPSKSSIIKSPPVGSFHDSPRRRASEGKVRFEDFAELPLKRKLEELEQQQQQHQRRRNSTSSGSHLPTEEVSEFKLRELKRERNALREQVSSLANFNYAREPEFVRDRLKLREVSHDVQRMIRHLSSRHLEPVVSQVARVEEQLAQLARSHEEESERKASEFLGATGTLDESEVEKFISDYVEVRKQASKKRILADRLAKERKLLASLSAGLVNGAAATGGGGGEPT